MKTFDCDRLRPLESLLRNSCPMVEPKSHQSTAWILRRISIGVRPAWTKDQIDYICGNIALGNVDELIICRPLARLITRPSVRIPLYHRRRLTCRGKLFRLENRASGHLSPPGHPALKSNRARAAVSKAAQD